MQTNRNSSRNPELSLCWRLTFLTCCLLGCRSWQATVSFHNPIFLQATEVRGHLAFVCLVPSGVECDRKPKIYRGCCSNPGILHSSFASSFYHCSARLYGNLLGATLRSNCKSASASSWSLMLGCNSHRWDPASLLCKFEPVATHFVRC